MALNEFKLAEAYTELTVRGFGLFTRTLGIAKSLIGRALIAPFRIFGNLIRRIFSPTGILIGGLGILAGAFGLAKVASEMEEVNSKFSAVFKDQEGAAQAFADDLAKSIGRSRTEIKGFLAGLQDTFVPLGFARKQARLMSQDLTQLAFDLTSFNPTVSDTNETIQLLTSAIVGNHESVRRFGITITETSLKQKLLDLGFKGNTQLASNQLKVLARLSLIYEGTSDAQGDLVRTGDSFKNSMARMWSQARVLAETLGNTLMPIFKSLVDLGSAVAETFNRALTGALPGFESTIGNIADTIHALANAVRNMDFSKWQRQLSDVFSGLWKIVLAGIGVLTDLLIDAAHAFVQILLDGIRAVASELTAQAVESVQPSIVAGVVQGAIAAGPGIGAQQGAGAAAREPTALDRLAQAMEDFRGQFGVATGGKLPSVAQFVVDSQTAMVAQQRAAARSRTQQILIDEQIQKSLAASNKAAGEKLAAGLRTPFEKFQSEIPRLRELLSGGFIDTETYRRALTQAFGKVPEADRKKTTRGEVMTLGFQAVQGFIQKSVTKGEAEIVKATKDVGVKVDQTTEAIKAQEALRLAWQ